MRYFSHGLFTGVQHLYTFNIVAPLFFAFCQMFESRRIPTLLTFLIDRPIARISWYLVLYRVPRSGSFTFTNRSYSHALILGEYGGCSSIFPLPMTHEFRDSTSTVAPWIVMNNEGVLYHESFVVFSWVLDGGSIGIGIDFDICPWSYGPVGEPLFWLLIPNPHWPCWSKKRKHNYLKKANSSNAKHRITFMNYVMKEYTNLNYMSRLAGVLFQRLN